MKFLSCAISVLLLCVIARSQHLPDSNFKVDVERPAYAKSTPRLMFDEAHNNFHTSTSRYKPFADLLMNDGYRLVVNRQPFTKKSLGSFKLLVIVNALGDDIDEPSAENPAFTDEECAVVRDWIRDGGALLLIVDPGPFAKANANLAKQVGVELLGNITEDSANSAEQFHSSLIVYSRENHQLLEHPITAGREGSEKVNRVVVFSGQSLKGPQDAVPFLKLGDSSRDVTYGSNGGAPSVVTTKGIAQGLAFKLGSGRVVVLGEADMLSALVGDPPEKEPIGMNYPGVDNKQLTLNIMHWLSGLLR